MRRSWLRSSSAAVAELESTEITEELRATEPVSLDGLDRGQGLDQRQAFREPRRRRQTCGVSRPWHEGAASSAGDEEEHSSDEDEEEWAPWLPGTECHKRLTEIALQAAATPASELFQWNGRPVRDLPKR